MENMRYTLITGASSGLGKELAIQCARMGMNMVLIALPGGNTGSIAEAISIQYGVQVKVVEFDLTDDDELKKNLAGITGQYPVDFLINNAGTGGSSYITETALEKIDRIILLNVRSTALITRLMIPHLLQHRESYIMNIASMAAFAPIAYKTVYPASKAFISSFSLGLKEELAGTGLSVSVVYPGPIMTNSNTSRRILSQGLVGRLSLLPTPCIARIALKRTLARHPVIIPGLMNRINHRLMSLIPLNIKLKIISRAVKKEIQFAPH